MKKYQFTSIFNDLTLFKGQIFQTLCNKQGSVLHLAIFSGYLECILRNRYLMHAEEIREYCLGKKGVEESFPFDDTTLVFKVGEKMFLLVSLDSNPVQFNAKCMPDTALELREKYNCVIPGYHMNKIHWNTVICDGSVSKKLIFDWINESYRLIVEGLPHKTRTQLGL